MNAAKYEKQAKGMRQRQTQGQAKGQSATEAHHHQFDASLDGSGVTQHAEQLLSLGELRENHFLKQKQQEGGRGCAGGAR
jgi:hypothetical protein